MRILVQDDETREITSYPADNDWTDAVHDRTGCMGLEPGKPLYMGQSESGKSVYVVED